MGSDPIDSTAPKNYKAITPEHVRVIKLRLRGKRWSQIAEELGVSAWTIWSWRQQNPEIDRIVASECADALEAGQQGLSTLVPVAAEALRQEMETPDRDVGKVRVSAAKAVLEMFKRVTEGKDTSRIPERLEGFSDVELDRALSAAVRERGERKR